ncbi:MAG: class I SAM-dependent methyltransferase [Chlorobia bacterium]|nr:class I SAM-dependent methyltransferase [Fimbriimonadaceae bacterium]
MELEAEPETGTGDVFRRQAWMEWTDPAVVEASIRWKEKAAVHHAELTNKLVSKAGLFEGAKVLDLASGTGEPPLTIASIIGPSGKIVASEISEALVDQIRRRTTLAGIPNLEVIQAEASALPFPDDSFDVVTCRLGVMYFAPVQSALAEIRRVLKPGGRVALLAWGMPEQGSYYASCIFPFLMRSGISPPPADAPTPLRFSPPGSLTAELQKAGFEQVSETREVASLTWPGPPEELWRYLYETATPLRDVFDSLSTAEFKEAYAEAMALLGPLFDGKETVVTAEVVVGWSLGPLVEQARRE